MSAETFCLDVIIPVYNEGRNILKVLDSLRNNVQTPFRVLICYDHDEDDTLPAIRSYGNKDFEIELVKNKSRGAHAAVCSGFEASTSDAVLVFPADDFTNSKAIDRMVALCKQGCDIVAPSRFMPGGCMKGCPWLKAVLVRTAAFTLHTFTGIPTRDATNGFRLFSRRLIDQVPIESSIGFTYSLELLVKAHRLGWRIAEVPVKWFERKQGKSRFQVIRWLSAYLQWYYYAFATAYLKRPASTVNLKQNQVSPVDSLIS